MLKKYRIYLLNEEGTNNYKIGITKNNKIEKRIKGLQTGNSNKIYVVEIYESDLGSTIEKVLHRTYNKWKKEGEWFEFENLDEIKFIETCTLIEKNLIYIKENSTNI